MAKETLVFTDAQLDLVIASLEGKISTAKDKLEKLLVKSYSGRTSEKAKDREDSEEYENLLSLWQGTLDAIFDQIDDDAKMHSIVFKDEQAGIALASKGIDKNEIWKQSKDKSLVGIALESVMKDFRK